MADPPRSDYDSPMAEAQQDDNTNNAANNNNDTNNQDDASDAATAVTAVYRPIPYEGDEKEYTIKFVFSPDDDTNKSIALLHYDILYSISQVFPEVKIFDNKGAKLNRKKLESFKAVSVYLRHFDLHYSKGNEKKQRKPMYIVIHRFQSKISISEIRRHESVHEKLLLGKAKMTQHLWNENETRISNLGFFVGFDPSNIPPDEMIEDVVQEIIKKTNKPRKKIPKFKCNYSSPFFKNGDDTFKTKAFDLQCRQHDAKELLELLQKTYVEDPKFIFHKFRHTNKYLYSSSMIEQNAYLRESKILPVAGIHPSVMWSLKDRIARDYEGVIRITGHKDTDRIGRHNIHTTEEHFDVLRSALRMSLPTLVMLEKDARNLHHLKDYDDPPRLAFRHESYGRQGTGEDDDDSTDHGGSYATYVSALNSLYTTRENEFQDDSNNSYSRPPKMIGPTTQVWKTMAPVQTVVASTTTETTTSQVTNEEYERMKNENAELKSELRELKDAFKSFVSKQEEESESRQEKMMRSMMQAMQQQMSAMMMQQNYMPPPNYAHPYQQQPQFGMSPINAQQLQQLPNNLFPAHQTTPVSNHRLPPNQMPLPQTPTNHQMPTNHNYQNHPQYNNQYQRTEHDITNPKAQSRSANDERNQDSEQQAASRIDVSMARANSPLHADESLADSSMQK